MTTAASNEIRSEMVLRAPRAKVWGALTTPEGWTAWFSEGVEGVFEVGQTLTLNFGEHGTCYAIVTERDEEAAFAYQWHPGEDCDLDKYPRESMTTVRFTLADHPDGTLLSLVESGFESIPEERRAKCVELNTGGWNHELAELSTYVSEGS